MTPAKTPRKNRSKISDISIDSENSNPNATSPGLKCSKSPAFKSAKKATQKSAPQNPNPVASPIKVRDRKFVVAKRNPTKDKACGNSKKCLRVAYDSLRVSQEEFIKNPGIVDDKHDLDLNQLNCCSRGGNWVEEEGENKTIIRNLGIAHGYQQKPLKPEKINDFAVNGSNGSYPDEIERSGDMGSSQIKRTRDDFLGEERARVPKPGSGRVMNLVKAFERLLTKSESNEFDQKDERETETERQAPSFCPSDCFLTPESLGLDSCVSSSSESCHGSVTMSSRTKGDGCTSRQNSSDSSGTFGGSRWKKRQLKATSQKPFKLRTEERGRDKEDEFVKKVQQMVMEEEKQRIRIAQGLPWTTDEPECLVKPPAKEITRPVDLMLHSDVRAEERAEFDQQVAGKLNLVEQYKMERDRQQKLAEEEEIRRLRKELVPKAQPMPYFDRPFIPARSQKHPTVPKEPKLRIPHQKKIECSLSFSDVYTLTNCELR